LENQETSPRQLKLNLASEFSQAAIQTSNIGIRTLILINGGAVIALLTLLGVLISSGLYNGLEYFLFALIVFALGVGSGGWISYLAYQVHLADFRYLLTFEEISDHPFAKELGAGNVEARIERLTKKRRAEALSWISLLCFFGGVVSTAIALWCVGKSTESPSLISIVFEFFR